MNTLIVTVGLPRSGKSTWSREYGKLHSIPVISGDAIRLAIHGTAFQYDAEELMYTMGMYMIKTLFHTGYTCIISDDCHYSRKLRQTRESTWYEPWATTPLWKTRYKVFTTPAEECIRRAYATDKPYLVDVIKNISNRFEPLQEDELLYEEWK